jgi:hypothetical protein
MTQFEGLQTAFNELKGKYNNLVTAFNSHVHLETGGSTNAPKTNPLIFVPASSSAADITAAKTTNILTN